MEKRLIFSEDVINYDLWRPRYTKALFNDIFQYANITEQSQVVEIGCGTGQATAPFLDKGCSVWAVELADKMVSFSKEKFSSYENFFVENKEFEKCSVKRESSDLIYSATAFHWIDEKVGYNKMMEILRPGGGVALFWNRPYVARQNDPLHQEIQNIYRRYAQAGHRTFKEAGIENDSAKYNNILNTIKQYGFVNAECRLYKQVRQFRPQDYVCLLNTYSDHRSMKKNVRERFEKEIIDAISFFGGILNVYDTIDLYLARKPK